MTNDSALDTIHDRGIVEGVLHVIAIPAKAT